MNGTAKARSKSLLGLGLIGSCLRQLRQNLDMNSFYRFAIDQTAIVATTDAKGIITYTNQAFERISGFSHDELIGSTHRIVNSGLMPPGFFENMWGTISKGTLWRGEICNRAKDGSLYWVDSFIVPISDCRGNIRQYISIRSEITERKIQENEVWKSNQLKQIMLDAVNYAVISTDTKGCIQIFSKSAEVMLGYSVEDTIGASPLLFHDHGEIEARKALLSYEINQNFESGFDVLIAKARLGEIDENEWTYVARDGRRVPVHMSVASLKDRSGGAIGYIFIARDISLQKKMYEEMVAANKEMKRLANVKSQFVANMSHEIRTPMNGVMGMCDILLDEAKDPEIRKKIMVIKESGESLLTLVNDFLDLAKIESGKFEFENHHFNPIKLIQDMIDLFKGRASEKGNAIIGRIDESTPNLVLGDALRFRQILSNLISNAIKFTECGSIVLNVKGKHIGENKFRIDVDVTDTGIGIRAENLNKIFVPFSQEDSTTTRRFGGTGLGLSICRNLCRGMGGDISVASVINEGTTMSFFIVVQVPDPSYSHDSLMSQIPLKRNLKILVAEDNKVNQIVVLGLLRKLKYEAELVENGLEVLSILEKKQFDLIFMDCHMPEMDGFEATKQILRRFQGRKRPHIVALSASAMKTDIEKCFAVGMRDFIAKPVSVVSLEAVIRKVEAEEIAMQEYGVDKESPDKLFAGGDSTLKTVKYRSLKIFNRIVSLVEKGDFQLASQMLGEMDRFEQESLGDCVSMLQVGLQDIEKLNEILGILNSKLSGFQGVNGGGREQ